MRHILGGTRDGADRLCRGLVRYGCMRVSIGMRCPRDQPGKKNRDRKSNVKPTRWAIASEGRDRRVLPVPTLALLLGERADLHRQRTASITVL